MDVDGVSVTARGITVVGPEGVVFANVSAHVEPGSLATVVGHAGTGRTSLLLTLSGRLRPVAGHLDVSGHVLPDRAGTVRGLVVPARVRPGFELQQCLRVKEVIRERRLTTGVTDDDVTAAFDLVGLDPDPDALISDLHPGGQLLVAVALGAAQAPPGLIVDDVDLGLPEAARTRAWTALSEVARTGTTVLASAADPPRTADETTVIRLWPEGEVSEDTTEPLTLFDIEPPQNGGTVR
ncbi:ABC-type multidrug transport system ATPase subunit [Saccharopolyspora lacisalsi]|uniref:ABC-type multidrug transport system ATPase subunit n=1 Tax=Halosaccharopolyspora lacisalsi TaxID=1000566 RepID=A0A839DYN1_9PSEU|nr:ATP-binding cassette domain-containing protein [Halosaccharopolyspora lacisalsi]MBA8826594.1 ABC-type multidrug transport system ATPase subunit [Halosaccharopolyspora lacisalsi]